MHIAQYVKMRLLAYYSLLFSVLTRDSRMFHAS